MEVGDQLQSRNDDKERAWISYSPRKKEVSCCESLPVSLLTRLPPRYVLAPTKNSPGFTVGDDYVLDTLDRLHVLRALEGGGIGAADLAHAAFH